MAQLTSKKLRVWLAPLTVTCWRTWCVCECGMTGAASNLRHALILVSMRNLNSLLLQLYLREKGESLGTVVISVPFTTFYDPAHPSVGQWHICSTHSANSSWTVKRFPLLQMTPNFGVIWGERRASSKCARVVDSPMLSQTFSHSVSGCTELF